MREQCGMRPKSACTGSRTWKSNGPFLICTATFASVWFSKAMKRSNWKSAWSSGMSPPPGGCEKARQMQMASSGASSAPKKFAPASSVRL